MVSNNACKMLLFPCSLYTCVYWNGFNWWPWNNRYLCRDEAHYTVSSSHIVHFTQHSSLAIFERVVPIASLCFCNANRQWLRQIIYLLTATNQTQRSQRIHASLATSLCLANIIGHSPSAHQVVQEPCMKLRSVTSGTLYCSRSKPVITV